MDDLSSMLSGLLNSPEGMEKIKNLASGLFGDSQSAPAPAPEPAVSKPSATGFGDISPAEIAGMMKVVTALKSGGGDNRTQLLMSLRPHLSPQRRKEWMKQ